VKAARSADRSPVERGLLRWSNDLRSPFLGRSSIGAGGDRNGLGLYLSQWTAGEQRTEPATPMVAEPTVPDVSSEQVTLAIWTPRLLLRVSIFRPAGGRSLSGSLWSERFNDIPASQWTLSLRKLDKIDAKELLPTPPLPLRMRSSRFMCLEWSPVRTWAIRGPRGSRGQVLVNLWFSSRLPCGGRFVIRRDCRVSWGHCSAIEWDCRVCGPDASAGGRFP